MLLILGCGSDGPPAQPAAQPPDLRLAVAPATTTATQRVQVQEFWRIYRQGTAQRVNGNYQTALTLFDSALVLQPGHLDALYYSGNAAFELGEFTDAERRWRLELAANEHSARAHAQLGMLYSSGLPGAPTDLTAARTELEAAHALNRAETGPLVRLGELALLQEDPVAAARWLAAATQTNTRSVAAVYLHGYVAWSEGKSAEAQARLLAARHLAGGGPEEVSASAEGQTRRGHRPLLESGRISSLAVFWRRLADSIGPDAQLTADTEYADFDGALRHVRAKLAAAP